MWSSKQCLRNLTVELVNDSGSLVNLRMVSVNQKKGEDILAGLIEVYVEEKIKYENELAESTIKMIDDRV